MKTPCSWTLCALILTSISAPRIASPQPSGAPLSNDVRSSTVSDPRSSSDLELEREKDLGVVLTSSVTLCKRPGQYTPCARSILQDSLQLESKYKIAIVGLVGKLRVETASLSTCKENLQGRLQPVVIAAEPIVEEVVWYYWLGERMLWLVGGGVIVTVGILFL